MIIGHQNIRARLRENFTKHAYAQSLLFVGPESVGKYAVALEYASLMLGGDAVHHADCMVLEPPVEVIKGISKIRDISIESVQDALHFLDRYPFSAQHKVLIIRDAHRMTESAQNAMLKIVEEPPSYACIIFITHTMKKILPTLLSRCQKILFTFLDGSEMSQMDGESKNTFLLQLGRPGLLVQHKQGGKSFAQKLDRVETLMQSSKLPLRKRLDVAEQCAKNTGETIELLSFWLGALHVQNMHECSEDTLLLMEKIENARLKLIASPSSARLILDAFLLHL